MAMVLNSDESSHFATGGLKRSRSGTFNTASHTPFGSSPSKSNFAQPRSYELPSPGRSPANSPDGGSPTREYVSQSYQSTPASSISLENSCEGDKDDQIAFPSYDDVGYYGAEDLEPPVSPNGDGESYTVSPISNSESTNASRPESPANMEHAEDDTAIRSQPSRHVDYLSHNWREEDIWSSWQLIVSKRGTYSNSARLENASWRTWMKAKYKLKTVSPETLNWLKDCDVTWLYGPLQTGSSKPLHMPNPSPCSTSRLSKSNSFIHSKKPILKKRSMSEIMLQRSLSASSLLKQAAAAVQAQQSGAEIDGGGLRPCINRACSDYVHFPFTSRRTSQANSSALQSVDSSGVTSPTYEKKHIHFNEQVEQYIAIDMGAPEPETDTWALDSDSDSDDGAIMMKRSNSKRNLPPFGGRNSKLSRRNSAIGEMKTIAPLESTTLKYKEDDSDEGTAQTHSFWSRVSPSSSQETLRPSKPSSGGFLLGDDSDDDLDDLDWTPTSAFANRRDSVALAQDRMNGLHFSGNREDEGSASASSGSFSGGLLSPAGASNGMRRTPSGMFMPTESDEEDAAVNDGLFGTVLNHVNTAKDIAHVIWNVGWRR